MSVLFKALEKAARQNAEAQEPEPADAGGGAYGAAPLGAVPPTRRRNGLRTAVRLLGLVFVSLTGALVAALLVFGDDVQLLLADAFDPTPAPVFAPAPPPTVAPAPEPEAAAQHPAAPAAVPAPEPLAPTAPPEVAQASAVEAAPAPAVEVAAAPPPEADPAPAVEAALAPSAEPTPAPAAEAAAGPAEPAAEAAAAPAEPAAADPEDDIALLMKEGAARRAAADGRAVPADAGPVVPAVAPASAVTAPEPPERVSVEDALAADQGRRDAAAVSAPITVGRDPGASGVGGVSVSVMPRDTQASLAEAYTDLVRGNYGAALQTYTAIAERDPREVAALAGRAAALHKLRRVDEAQAAYERVLALQPDNREALANMITLIGDSAPRDAVRRLEALQAQAPDFSPVPAQLGMLYARLGDVDRAAAALRRAIGLSPDNALYHYNLAVVTDRAGRRADALRAYQQVLQLIEAGAGGGIDPQPVRQRVAFLRARS
ncbi:tetratricopeptide repeat protein [Caenispirillum bisanense]|uniref:Coatomer epsilon subunit n=1 Tax=Caenispirillum bisanense TaxID=414052 RepID=A0A286GXX6_9PROT|nr:tetratricopeptide repeat protein [Caenispirillum bisanense]SOE00036.1 Coatomer epsilon subunit [Caenispirillum bisanense]